MTTTPEEVARWRIAYGPKPPEKPDGLIVDDTVLLEVGPFPSLHVNDFCVFLESHEAVLEAAGGLPVSVGTIRKYIFDLGRELAWAYGNWHKAQRDGDPGKLMIDLMNNARMPDYAFTLKFLTDYAKANNIPLGKTNAVASWEALLADFATDAEVIPEGSKVITL